MGHEYATEAVTATHHWMTMRKLSSRTACIIHPENVASAGIAEKLGYRRFGEAQYRGASPIMFERSGY